MAVEKGYEQAFSEAQYDMCPELRYFTSGQAPIDDLEIYFRFQKGWPTTINVVGGIVMAFPLFYLFHDVLSFSRGVAIGMLILVNLFLSWLLLGMIVPKLRQRQIRSALRERLHELGIITCQKCAYDLRGSLDRCPECGTLNKETE